MSRKKLDRPGKGWADVPTAGRRGGSCRPLSLPAALLLVPVLLLSLAACERRQLDEEERGAPDEREELVERRRERAAPIADEEDDLARRGSRQGEGALIEEDVPLPRLAQIPPYEFGAAPEETEPNDEQEQATPLARDGNQHVGRGRLVGEDKDWFVFTAEGEPQLWTIEATGEDLCSLEYHSAIDRLKLGERVAPPERLRIANLFLLPGRHWLRLEGREGDIAYTVRAVPLGPPDPGIEQEPNDDLSRAHLLTFGVPRAGFLLEEDDKDNYHFYLTGTDHLELRLSPPVDLAARLTVWERQLTSASRRVALAEGRAPGQPVVYRALLPAGGYVAEVSANGRSEEAYRLRLSRLDPFDLPADLEPNDSRLQARPLPADLRLTGEVAAHDEDWYRLPALSRETVMTIEVLTRPAESRPSGFLELYREGEDREVEILEWDEEQSRYQAGLAAETGWVVRLREVGPYEVRFAFDPGPAAEPAPGPLPVDLSWTEAAEPRPFAAYWHQTQRRELPLALRNTSRETQQLVLEATSSHQEWRATVGASSLVLSPARTTTVPVSVIVPPDAWAGDPVRVTVRARNENGAWVTAAVDLTAECGSPPLEPHTVWPLPEQMLGGLNVAWSALGGRMPGADEDVPEGPALLFDGLTPNDAGWSSRQLPASVTAELAGEEPVPVVGVLLNPRTNEPAHAQVREFALSLSLDGREFTKVLSGVLGRHPVEQVFPLPRTIAARFARLEVLSRHGGTDYEGAALGEWKVVAAPGAHPFAAGPLDLARPARGGHVVWSDPLVNYEHRFEMLSEEVEEPKLKLDPVNPNRWVIGFHHDRAAQITELQWVQSPEKGSEKPFLSRVQVAVSTETPLGPWSPVGAWTLDPAPQSASTLKLPAPVWARYVRFSTTEPDAPGEWHLPETLRIFERLPDAEYRSILGEWGHYSRDAVYERLHGEAAHEQVIAERDDNESRRTAQRLAPDRRHRGEVLVGEDVDWYRLEVPKGHNRLRLEVAGDPALRVTMHLEDEAGCEVPWEEKGELSARQAVLDLAVEPGARYYLRIEEPPRSIVLSWDNSASTNPFKTTIYQALPQFVSDVRPGREFVNLLPFQTGGGDFLLPGWSDQPWVLQAAINDYDRYHTSSDAERALLTATEHLAKRTGTRAVVLLTDAETFSYDDTAILWRWLSEVRPHVFTLELHRGNAPAGGRAQMSSAALQQDLMQAWAAVNGRYDFFRAHADLQAAFDRASCHLRRPAGYLLSASTRFEEPPGPGRILVSAPAEAIAGNAIELIVDASGSMLQRLEGRRRIDIAREVLLDLVENVIPAGTPLALRIFGHRTPRACQTDLEVAVEPLDAARVGAILRQVEAKNYAKTPIGRSLELVAEDLEGAQGQKIVVLVTDGEETCDGDPPAVIEGLKDQGVDVRVNIVGFAIEDEALKQTFRRWADLGGGLYFNATSGEELGRTLRQALQPKFQVIDPAGDVVASGVVGGEGVSVAAGLYLVRVLTTPPSEFEDVRVEGEDLVRLDLRR